MKNRKHLVEDFAHYYTRNSDGIILLILCSLSNHKGRGLSDLSVNITRCLREMQIFRFPLVPQRFNTFGLERRAVCC